MFRAGCLFGNFDAVGSTQQLLDITVDGELTGSQTANHEQTSRQTSEGATDTKLAGNLDKTRDSALTGETLGLVDLGQHSVSGLRDDGSRETSQETSSQIDTGLGSVRQLGLVKVSEDRFGELLVCDELGDSVGHPRFSC